MEPALTLRVERFELMRHLKPRLQTRKSVESSTYHLITCADLIQAAQKSKFEVKATENQPNFALKAPDKSVFLSAILRVRPAALH